MSGKGKVMMGRESGETAGVGKVGRARNEERQRKLDTEEGRGKEIDV